MTNARDRNQRMRSLFANVNPDDLAKQAPPLPSDLEKRRVGSVAVKSMDRAFVSIEEENKRLHQQLLGAEAIVELDPDTIEPSFVRDRLEIEENENFAAFVDGIRENGQRLPILVRPLAHRPGHYQVAYGHRRLRACQILKRPVKALVRELTDEELVISQGIENAERLNLSFIEQAFFALTLKDQGYSRETISEALGRKEKKGIAYISHLTNVASAVPEELVRAIGPAPAIGRPKWEKLGLLISDRRLNKAQQDRINGVQSSSAWQNANSDQRFDLVLRALQTPDAPRTDATEVALGHGAVATVQFSARATKVTLPESAIPGLSEWLVARLPDLAAEFRRQKHGEDR